MILRLHQLARSRGGRCLSIRYDSQNQKCLWLCEAGHKWYASSNSIIYLGSWCPVCAGNQKLTLDELKQLAYQRGGKCLETEYSNSKTKMLWQCQNGHQWNATAFSIKIRKSWCPVCYETKFKTNKKSHEILFKQNS